MHLTRAGLPLALLFLAQALWLPTTAYPANTFQKPSVFLEQTFAGKIPRPSVLWLKGEIANQVRDILGHRYPKLRIRYWRDGLRSAWILDEIGKDLPITTGVIIENEKIASLRVLIFRESRGWEVRYPFFTDQFHNARLATDMKLDRDIDNISGATLSVRAVKKIARLALYLDRITKQKDVAP